MSKPKLFMTGGDYVNWALDEDLRLTRQSLDGMVELSTLADCEVIHCVWWEGLLAISEDQLVGKRIICHMPNPPFHYLKHPLFQKTLEYVGRWVVRSTEAKEQFASIGIESQLIPYTVDVDIFRPLPSDHPELISFRQRWNIPTDHYLIGNFHRDTEGRDLVTPKNQKGPDIFAQIMQGVTSSAQPQNFLAKILQHLSKDKSPICVVLAGPRRFWIRKKLTELGIPYIYVGQQVAEGDDYPLNILSRETLNLIYNLIDLYLITSRWEGGPQSIMEAAASQCKVISTRVGLAADILKPDCIYANLVEASEIIKRDLQTNHLQTTLAPHYQRILEKHRPESVVPKFQELYHSIEQIPQFYCRQTRSKYPSIHGQPAPNKSTLTVGIWHKFFKPPYGGGNQFMLALRKAMQSMKVNVIENQLIPQIDAYILNSVHFDIESFRQYQYQHERELRIVHRVDGPIHLYRGFDREKDELCFALNAEFASFTVLQSAWTLQRIVEMGYQPINPVIIHNAVDQDIFHRRGRIAFSRKRKIRLISTSWSDNPRKGGPIYKWLDQHLDWDRFEYTFVGNTSEEFEHIRRVPPVPSEKLADILRQHDIYLTASRNDPCSNALIEALTCGLPAFYLNSGGHPELVGYGGLPFNEVEEILPLLDVLVENYEMFQNVIVVPSLAEVTEKYLTLLHEAVQ